MAVAFMRSLAVGLNDLTSKCPSIVFGILDRAVGPGAHNLLARIVIDNDGVDITVIVDEPDIVLGLKLERGFPWPLHFSRGVGFSHAVWSGC